jgi:hypothetical protein
LITNWKKTSHANITWADAADSELWDNVDCSGLKAILLSISDEVANINIMNEIKRIPTRTFKVFAIGRYPDQIERYKTKGFDLVFDYNSYVGKAYAEKALEEFQGKL